MQPCRSWLIFSIALIFIGLFNNQIWAQQSIPTETDEEMIEDFAMEKAIEEGQGTELVGRDEIFSLLESNS